MSIPPSREVSARAAAQVLLPLRVLVLRVLAVLGRAAGRRAKPLLARRGTASWLNSKSIMLQILSLPPTRRESSRIAFEQVLCRRFFQDGVTVKCAWAIF